MPPIGSAGLFAAVSFDDGKTWASIDSKTGLLDDNVYALAVAPNGDIWAGTRRGVAHLGQSKGK